MNNLSVQEYLDEILYHDLEIKLVPKDSIYRIQQDIKNNMLSFLSHYDSLEFRKAFFVLVEEQSLFYEPSDISLDIRSFVVTTVRNSLLEYLFSVNYRKMQIKNSLEEGYIKDILTHACYYFNNCNFEDLCLQAKRNCTNDFYGDLIQKYPLAYAVLVKIGCKKNNPIRYQKVKSNNFLSFMSVQLDEEKKGLSVKKVKNGISSELDKDDLVFLRHIELGEMPYVYFDSFKMLSRNPDKVMKFLEFILQKDGALVTSNYYITNGYIEKRIPILQAAHTLREADIKFLNHSGLLLQHKRVLEEIRLNDIS